MVSHLSALPIYTYPLVLYHICKIKKWNDNILPLSCGRQISLKKKWRNLPISNPKPHLHNVNAHTKSGEYPPIFYSSYHPETKIQTCSGQIIDKSCQKLTKFVHWLSQARCPQSMHIPSFVKIHWYLLKLSFENRNADLWEVDNSVKNWRNLPISNPKPDFHNINAHTKFGENPLIFTQVIVQKGKYWRTYNRQTPNVKP